MGFVCKLNARCVSPKKETSMCVFPRVETPGRETALETETPACP